MCCPCGFLPSASFALEKHVSHFARRSFHVSPPLCPSQSSYKPIVEFIDTQFEAYLQEELKIKRVLHNYHDSRIHACLYFVAPTGHSLKSLDLVTMKKLDSKVGVVRGGVTGLLFLVPRLHVRRR